MRRRPQDPRVQRAAGHDDVARELRLAGHLVGAVTPPDRLADDRVGGDRLERRLSLRLALDPLAGGQLAVGHRALRVVRVADQARLHPEPIHRHLHALGRHLQEHRPRVGGCLPHDRAELANAERPERAHVPRAQVRVAHDDVHRRQRHVELLGEQHRERGDDTLAHLDLADQAGDLAVGGDVQVGVDVGRIALASRRKTGGLLAGGERIDGDEHQQAGGRQLDELAPVHGEGCRTVDDQLLVTVEVGVDGLHRAPPFIAPAAASTALTMRTCAPHRHR